ncbi:glycerophosphodiester phosphodiesterase family protein [Pseudobacter ginsenosidimutans]|uniref:Glycerophosphoryl diester phosphodiesterase n=1 Tax=Pseudobacter ginsenosidimutans TaxID=661488 RepID=A0A4Q7N3I9_9BACT|nr:glycerophosphodiester phosphodiesterase family protein [Pseudobacter ginsenosidimutans]RZS75198.1 glycerophosphoryl diester phosphodiesterase [Pseudobacter ginsenosidimutans]
MKLILPLIAAGCLAACGTTKQTAGGAMSGYPKFFKEGHRGTRGLMPENTIPSMKKAIEIGANFIEVDVYLSKDGQVLIAHDPFANIAISTLPDGRSISKDSAKLYTWHQMNYADIRRIDVGSKGNPAYPQQQKLAAYMPLLGELIDSVEAFTAARKLKPTIYNIEIKSNPKMEGVYQPAPDVLVKAIMDVVSTKKIGNRFYLQSFDMRPLQSARRLYPEVIIGFLTGDAKHSVDENVKALGFRPDIYSPAYQLVNAATVEACKKHGMKLVPWTVNTAEEIDKLVKLGVNGIITDYPNLLSKY